MASLQNNNISGAGKLLLLLVFFLCFGAFAQPDPCGCPEGEIYVPPGPIEDYSPCDPFNLIEYCQPDTSEIPISDHLYVLVFISVGYLGYLGHKYKTELYRSR